MDKPVEDERDTLGSLASVLTALAFAPGGPGPLEEGQVVAGKYVIEEVIGQGGMGVVYRARDERLQRTVALKLGHAASASALARLEQEAQTLAKLSHPNVVVIHEVGEHAGRVFVAMEYATGGTARTWLAAKPRSWRSVVALYAAAGDGLAAAHDAKIIHRDFKPDNLIVGADERPRVADFGLARDVEAATEADGAAVGTLPYMAPEQLAGESLDARADQYSFCASLWEALFGVRPFEGKAAVELRAAIEAGAPRVPRSATRRPPSHIVEALKTGLRARADDRWSSMRLLLTELRRDPLARWRGAGLVVAALVAVACLGMLIRLSRRHDDLCDGGEQRQRVVWSPIRATAFEEALTAAGGVTAARTLRAGIDAYSSAWVDAERDACRATRVVGNQSEAILDRRMTCLRRADAQLDSVVEAATANPRQALEREGNALSVLPDLRSCADTGAIASQAALPADPALRKEIDTLGAQLAKIRTAVLLLSAPTSRADADAALVSAKRIGWAPLVAEVEYTRALTLAAEGGPPAREALEVAFDAALASGSDELAAEAAAELADALVLGGDIDAGQRWLRVAEAESTRVGHPPRIGARMAGVEALIIAKGPNPAEALTVRRRQVELAQRAHRGPIEDAHNELNITTGFVAAGRLDDAAHELEIGMTQIRAAVGDDQPVLLDYLNAAFRIAVVRGKFDEAETAVHKEMAIAEHWFGRDSKERAAAVQNLAALDQRRGHMKEAEASSREALAIFDRVDPRSPQVGELSSNLAMFALGRGNLEEAEEKSGRALANLERTRGRDSTDIIDILLVRAAILREQKKMDVAEAHERRAVDIADRADGAVDRVNPRIELSYTLVAAGRAAEAARLLDAVTDSLPKIEPRIAAEFHSSFADALFRSGNRGRAHEEGARALDAFTALGESFDPQRKAAAAWLAAH